MIILAGCNMLPKAYRTIKKQPVTPDNAHMIHTLIWQVVIHYRNCRGDIDFIVLIKKCSLMPCNVNMGHTLMLTVCNTLLEV